MLLPIFVTAFRTYPELLYPPGIPVDDKQTFSLKRSGALVSATYAGSLCT